MMAKVLVIEDNPTNMKLAHLLLKTSGHDVLQAVNALDGIDIARKELPAVILMDIQLPGMDGLTATRMLKQESITSHIKIIALTAFAMKGDEEKMRQAGCDGYIAKPIRYKEFLETVDGLL
jgi:two-component system, cell cycle response regulator DivK